jgi:hypothetical protein
VSRAEAIVLARSPAGGLVEVKDVDMVIVDCPMCLGPIALGDEDVELTCEDCSIHVEFAADERAEVVARAA